VAARRFLELIATQFKGAFAHENALKFLTNFLIRRL